MNNMNCSEDLIKTRGIFDKLLVFEKPVSNTPGLQHSKFFVDRLPEGLAQEPVLPDFKDAGEPVRETRG